MNRGGWSDRDTAYSLQHCPQCPAEFTGPHRVLGSAGMLDTR